MKDKLNTDVIRLWVEPATREANDDLYKRVVAKDEAAREQMIRSNGGLVLTEVERFLWFLPKFNYLRDDLISAGFVGLVEAVNTMSGGIVENPTAFMGYCIRCSFGKTIESDEMIRVPAKTRRKKSVEGITLEAPKKAVTIFPEGEDDGAFSYDPRNMQNLRETLDACCEDDTDREIQKLRESGHVDREISEILGIPLTTVYVMRRTMYARFLELTEWRGEA